MFNKNNNEGKIIIANDPGKHTNKALTHNNRLSFRTKLFKNDIDIDAIGNSFRVGYDRNKYIVGNQAEESSFDVSKTNLIHKLVTYVAITQLMGNNNIIQLVLNCPVSIYKNKQLRDEYKEYIFNNGKVNIEVNNQEYNFKFENILILPEDYGVVYKYPQYFKNKRTALIGLGGLNMNFMIISENLSPEVSTMFTVNHGSNELEVTIINELNSRFGINLDHKNAPLILREGGFKEQGVINRESIIIVDNVVKSFINKIIQETKKNGHNLDNLDVVFVGGTSLSIKYRVEDYLRHAMVIDNAQWVGVEGSYTIGEIKYAEN